MMSCELLSLMLVSLCKIEPCEGYSYAYFLAPVQPSQGYVHVLSLSYTQGFLQPVAAIAERQVERPEDHKRKQEDLAMRPQPVRLGQDGTRDPHDLEQADDGDQ